MEEVITKNIKDFIHVYPNYLDKENKVNEGRKVNKEKCVSNVTCEEIFNAVSKVIGLKCTPQYKHHPQDWLKRGRVLVELYKDGKAVNSNFTNKTQLLNEISNLLLKHRELMNKDKEKEEQEVEEEGTTTKKKRRVKK